MKSRKSEKKIAAELLRQRLAAGAASPETLKRFVATQANFVAANARIEALREERIALQAMLKAVDAEELALMKYALEQLRMILPVRVP